MIKNFGIPNIELACETMCRASAMKACATSRRNYVKEAQKDFAYYNQRFETRVVCDGCLWRGRLKECTERMSRWPRCPNCNHHAREA